MTKSEKPDFWCGYRLPGGWLPWTIGESEAVAWSLLLYGQRAPTPIRLENTIDELKAKGWRVRPVRLLPLDEGER